MLTVTYTECHKKPLMLSVIMLSVVMLSVVTPIIPNGMNDKGQKVQNIFYGSN